MLKKLILFALLIFFHTIMHAQYASWMIGTWNSRSGSTTSGNFTNTIKINDVSRESFTGTKAIEISNTKITISISGGFRGRGLYLQDGDVIQKEGPENGQWHNCSACSQNNKMMISHDSLILTSSISDCDNGCDGETFYYRLLSEYDDDTQRYLVDRFGRPSDIIAFRPFSAQEDKAVASGEDTIKKVVTAVTMVPDPTPEAIKNAAKRRQDSTSNSARIKQQQTDNAARLAQQKKQEKQVNDSLNLLLQKEQRHLKDSLANIAKLEKIRVRTEDSLRDVQAKKHEQQTADSINLAQQKKQERIKDSLNDVAKIKQQQITDAALLAQQKKREKEVADSLDILQQKAELRVKDSLQNIAAANLQKHRIADSLRDTEAKKRQQQITDSLVAVRKQQYNDSLQKAALAKAVPPAKSVNDSSDEEKALTSRSSVLLGSYHITTPDILIELFDNGEIDGDRVSVYHNNTIIVNNQMLNKNAITLNIHADTANREHEFILVAENLGSIPPNSALMRVTVGKQIYKLSVNTDMKTNARIEFYYDGN